LLTSHHQKSVGLAEKLIEAPIDLVHEDGAARSTKHFLIYNLLLSILNSGLRRSALLETVRLVEDLLHDGVRPLYSDAHEGQLRIC
jgi:ATP-dependent helicase YprA (DUF1998 family)